jgi:hypothetical protein
LRFLRVNGTARSYGTAQEATDASEQGLNRR